jgi:uncharacterized repeat protein (TIGR03803 family)
MASISMQRNASARRRPLLRVVLGFASAVLLSQAALAAPFSSNVITVFGFGSAIVNDLAGAVAVGGLANRGDLLLANDGNLYVSTSAGGSSSVGAIMRISPTTGAAVVMHAFIGGTEGITPYSGLIQGADGALYGTTFLGGSENAGTVYKMALDGTFTTLVTFTSKSQGAYEPYAGLVQGTDGTFYGTTLRGGTNNVGTVFKMTATGTMTVLHSFVTSDGSNPEGKLVFGADGALYGTTLTGGASDRGVIYKITTTGTFAVVYSFPGLGAFNAAGVATNVPGANPRAGLLLGQDGNFYGTTYQGGATGFGTVFRATPAGALTVVHAFGGGPLDGAGPLAGVSQGADGTLYGTTERGGFNSAGVAWRISAAGTYSLLHSFSSSAIDGGTLYTRLLPANGFLYGVSYTDAYTSGGVLFKLDEGTAGVLPLSFSLSSETIAVGGSTTLSYSSPAAATCVAGGAWDDTIGTSGTKAISQTIAGIYNYVITCTDGAGVVRNAYAELIVTAPAAQTVDGGATTGGGGALSLLSLGALASAFVARRRRKSSAV